MSLGKLEYQDANFLDRAHLSTFQIQVLKFLKLTNFLIILELKTKRIKTRI